VGHIPVIRRKTHQLRPIYKYGKGKGLGSELGLELGLGLGLGLWLSLKYKRIQNYKV
jgi:hypothetical protein